jgi:serine/threonine protein kinase
MAFRAQENADPIPGYTLVNRLGSGGYGEVWKAIAPGGLRKAIKIIYGQLQEHRAEQELKALSRIKEVRHPFLLSLERFEIIDGQLVIVMELADQSLMDRFQECQTLGMPGIPREELLGYIRDAADALDYMNDHHGLQHLDIKPQNMLLVGGRVKIADFGMVKDLEGTSVTATGGVTPVYASPEAFDARVSRFSDQYSLAVVYQEMLTGFRPFPGQTAMQLAAQHTSSPPMLEPLPVGDRASIARALAKLPDQRFPNCRQMVEELLKAGAGEPVPYSGVQAAPEQLQAGKASPLTEPAVSREADKNALLAQATEVSPPPSQNQQSAVEETKITKPAFRKSFLPARPAKLRPTLFLGIGGLASAALFRLKQRLYHRFRDLASVPVLALLQLDTDRKALEQLREGRHGEALTLEETLLVPLRRTEDYRPQAKELLRWLDRRWLYGIPRSLMTEGMRPLGRLALVDNASVVLARLRDTLARVVCPKAKSKAAAAGFDLREDKPRVFLVASLAGGTGGGMYLDVAYAVRQVLAEMQIPDDALCALLLHATGRQPAARDLARINSYAALLELNHFARLDSPSPGDFVQGLAPVGPGEVPFKESYLIHLGDHLDKTDADAATHAVAEYLYLNTTTTAGKSLEQHRMSARPAPTAREGGMSMRTFGLAQISFPRYSLAELAADLFCVHLINRWRGESTGQPDGTIDLGPLPEVCAGELEETGLANRFREAAAKFWGQEPEAYFRKLLADSPLGSQPPAAQRTAAETTGQLLDHIDALLIPKSSAPKGKGDLSAATSSFAPSPAKLLKEALRERGVELVGRLSRALLDWLVAIVDDPNKRFKAADRATRLLVHQIRNAIATGKTRLAQIPNQLQALRKELTAPDKTKKGSGSIWLGRKREQSPAAELQAVVSYGMLRLEEIALENALAVLEVLVGRVADFAQDSMICRQKLSQFAATFQSDFALAGALPPQEFAAANFTEILPGQAKNLGKAAESALARVGPALLAAFDESFQRDVLDPQGGLWRRVSGNVDLVQMFKDELLGRAQVAILEATADIDAAQLFLESPPQPGDVQQELLNHVQESVPRLSVSQHGRRLVVAVPSSPAGAAVRDELKRIVQHLPMTVLESEGDIILCQESGPLLLPQVAAQLIANDAGHVDTAHRVLTRVDVAWSPLSAETKSEK